MAFIQITNAETFIKSSTIEGWVITKVDGSKIFTTQETPFDKAFENGYLLITDIFGRTIYLNANQCIEMVKTPFTKVERTNTTELYEGELEVRTGYTNSMDTAKPLSLKDCKNICG
jgi:hypothetical protein